MGRIEWDIKDCMQSRQDYIIWVKEKRRDTDSEGDSPGVAARRAELCGVTPRGVLSWQHFGNVYGVLRTYEEGRFGSVMWQEVR